MAISFANQPGLWAFLILIPFLLLYLIRPKPTKLNIPSLMFFFVTKDKSRKSSFLRNFLNDLLFLLQLLIFALLCLQIAEPFHTYTHDVTAENTVFVIDVSASSQVQDGSQTRFERSISKARDLIGASNTIILAKQSPYIALERVSGGEANAYLRELTPLETESRIGEAILLAGEIMDGQEGRVIVLSDFINTGGTPPEIAADILKTKGIIVDLINTATGNPVSNIGIVDISADEETTLAYVKNYNDNQETVTIKIANLEKQLTIAPKSIETFAFTTPEKVTKVEIDANDDFDVDNEAYISAPSHAKVNVLLVSSQPSIFLKAALSSSPEVQLTISEPPVISSEPQQIYVFHEITPGKILPGTFEDLQKKVQNEGASVIIHAQNDLTSLDFKGLLPVTLQGKQNGAPLVTQHVNQFTKNIEFGSVQEYFQATPKERAITIVSGRNNSIIAYQKQGAGKIIYYGIIEDSSDFKFSPSYPIFWNNLLDFLLDKRSVKSLNAKTGDTLLLQGTQSIKLPNGRTLRQGTLTYEEQGVYELGDRNIAVNLLNDKESNIMPTTLVGEGVGKAELKPITEERNFDWELPLLIAASILLFIELFYVKFRGDV